MAQVTPQNKQLIDKPASIRAMQAAFRQQDRSWPEDKEQKQTSTTPADLPSYQTAMKNVFLKDTDPASCSTCRMSVSEERGWRDKRRDASQVSRTHCSWDRSLTPRNEKEKSVAGSSLLKVGVKQLFC